MDGLAIGWEHPRLFVPMRNTPALATWQLYTGHKPVANIVLEEVSII
jgi:hypothetical protein